MQHKQIMERENKQVRAIVWLKAQYGRSIIKNRAQQEPGDGSRTLAKSERLTVSGLFHSTL